MEEVLRMIAGIKIICDGDKNPNFRHKFTIHELIHTYELIRLSSKDKYWR